MRASCHTAGTESAPVEQLRSFAGSRASTRCAASWALCHKAGTIGLLPVPHTWHAGGLNELPVAPVARLPAASALGQRNRGALPAGLDPWASFPACSTQAPVCSFTRSTASPAGPVRARLAPGIEWPASPGPGNRAASCGPGVSTLAGATASSAARVRARPVRPLVIAPGIMGPATTRPGAGVVAPGATLAARRLTPHAWCGILLAEGRGRPHATLGEQSRETVVGVPNPAPHNSPSVGKSDRRDTMGMTKTGSGIVIVGYSDTIAGIVLCIPCADRNNDSYDMDAIYSPDVNDDTPPCFSCGASLDR